MKNNIRMHQKAHFLTLFIAFTSLSICFGTSRNNLVEILDTSDHRQDDRRNNPAFKSLPGRNTKINAGLRLTINRARTSSKVVNVDDFGAKGNGGDDSGAFKEAWEEACSSSKRATTLLVPKDKTYHLKPITFSGPCKSHLTIQIDGTIKASPKMLDYEKDRRHWLSLENVQNLIVQGSGIINGNGRKWWLSSCKINKSLPCKDAPTAVTFFECKNLTVTNLKFMNSQKIHLSFEKCTDVKASNLLIIAPEDSPNTDGIHVAGTENILIKNCIIMTGDDCISIVSASKNVQATDIRCGPGHGISIGSLGAGHSEAEVSNVAVNRATFSGTTNGVRIKTWQGGFGYAENIQFQNILMINVSNPIIIDQNYCDQDKPCLEQASAVQISNVVYKNIIGTSTSEEAIKFDCSKTFPCQGILLQEVDLKLEGDDGAKASCQNARFFGRGKVYPKCSSP